MNRYEKIFKEYVSQMRRSMKAANKWWAKLHRVETQRLGDPERAAAEIEARWPFGAASHPLVLATYRKYFLEIEHLNKEIEDLEAQSHEHFDGSSSEEDRGVDDAEDEDEDEDDPDSFGEEENPTPAWNVLIDRLSGRDEELRSFLAGMVFAPIGVDQDDNFT
jgi:hypothetical protein